MVFQIEAYNSDRDVGAFSRFIDDNVERLLKTQGQVEEENLYRYDDHSATYHEVAGQVIELTTKNMDKALKRPGLLFVVNLTLNPNQSPRWTAKMTGLCLEILRPLVWSLQSHGAHVD